MPKSKRKRKKRASARHIKEVAGLIAIQQRRAARPAIAVNTQARVSESLVERRRKLDTKRRQRRDWDDL